MKYLQVLQKQDITITLFQYIPNRQFKVIWIDNTANQDIVEGIIWLQNNQIYKFQLDNTEFNWHKIQIATNYISFNKAIKTISNGFIFTGYRYFDPSDKPLDLIKYLKIIEIQ
ncbi:MAG: hypothetical protein U9Q83_11620 [Bacteroidota bacterium]|nr:hypothetical protein [Bacteroidota bacterium]